MSKGEKKKFWLITHYGDYDSDEFTVESYETIPDLETAVNNTKDAAEGEGLVPRSTDGEWGAAIYIIEGIQREDILKEIEQRREIRLKAEAEKDALLKKIEKRNKLLADAKQKQEEAEELTKQLERS